MTRVKSNKEVKQRTKNATRK